MTYPKPTAERPERPRKRAPRRPLRMPEPIDATPDEIARVVLNAPPKREWDYLNGEKRQRRK